MTLDFCGFDFASEAQRSDRLQVNYVRNGEPKLSNEVVTYKPGGAELAMREVNIAASHCPRGPVPSHVAGVPPLTYRATFLTAPHLLPNYVALRLRISGTVNGKRSTETLFTIYQLRHNILSALYAYGGTEAARRLALHAAAASATNLKLRA